jgi:pyruvate kinase
MLAKIAAYTEMHSSFRPNDQRMNRGNIPPTNSAEAIADMVEHALLTVPIAGVFVPTLTGNTARMISRYNPPVWIVAFCKDANICQGLAFSYGVHPVQLETEPEDWSDFARHWLNDHKLKGDLAMLVAGPSDRNPGANHRLEFLRVGNR